MTKLTAMPLDLEALDIWWTRRRSCARVSAAHHPARTHGPGARVVGDGELLEGDAERTLWAEANAFAWAGVHTLVKIPLLPARLGRVDARLAQLAVGAVSQPGAGWPGARQWRRRGFAWLTEEGLAGLVVRADDATSVGPGPLLGAYPGRALFARVKRTLDPDGRFPDYIGTPVAVA
ncbi:MAG: hypothetical protein R2854_30170 [Caldilineaceae bacterium]